MTLPARIPKFHLLDAARGIAALVVVMRHTPTLWNGQFFHSYLAVDIFFLLSSFVIAHAYDSKLRTGSLNALSFLLIRLIRLYPIYLLSILIAGTIALNDILADGTYMAFGSAEVATMSLLAALFLPTYTGLNSQLFPLNVPLWSLFMEMAVNILYGCLHKYLCIRRMAVVVTVTGLIMVMAVVQTGTIDHGFRWQGAGVYFGLVRCTFGIALGILLYRTSRIHIVAGKLAAGFPAIPALALAAAVAPLLVADLGKANGVIDILSITVLFPASVVLMASASASRWSAAADVLGSISYPIYALHMPIFHTVSLFAGGFLARHAPFAGVAFLILIAGIGLAFEKFYDIPVRRALSQLLHIRQIRPARMLG